jgi:TRAP-type C4-dicarboxylate transport system substrate-binding protein
MRGLKVLFPIVLVSFIMLCGSFSGPDSAQAAEKIKIKGLASWGTEMAVTREFFVPIVDKLNAESGGRLDVSWVGPEAVPAFQQLKPLRDGLFDILYTHSGYHTGEVAIGNAMDLFKGTAKERRAAGFYEILDEGYKKIDLKVLGLNPIGVGYHFILQKELKHADFSGLKIRTSPFYDPLVKALGGSPVKIATPEIYSALEKGIVDGVAQVVFGAYELKWYEVAKFMLRPTYGENVQILLVNLDSWNKFPKDIQNLITKVVMEVEEGARERMKAKWKVEEAELLRLGMKKNILPPADGEKLLRTFYERTFKENVIKYSPNLGSTLKKQVDEFKKAHGQ